MADSFTKFMNKLEILQEIAGDYASHTKVANWLVLDTLRSANSHYVDGFPFKVSIGEVNQNFLDHLKSTDLSIYNYFVKASKMQYARDPSSLKIDVPHLAVSMQGVQSTTVSHYDDYVTWAGDVASAVNDVNYKGATASKVIGSSHYSCSNPDIRADVDTINIMDSYKSKIQKGTMTIYSVFTSYFADEEYEDRWTLFKSHFASTNSRFKREINKVMDDTALVALTGRISTKEQKENFDIVVESFCKYIIDRT